MADGKAEDAYFYYENNLKLKVMDNVFDKQQQAQAAAQVSREAAALSADAAKVAAKDELDAAKAKSAGCVAEAKAKSADP